MTTRQETATGSLTTCHVKSSLWFDSDSISFGTFKTHSEDWAHASFSLKRLVRGMLNSSGHFLELNCRSSGRLVSTTLTDAVSRTSRERTASSRPSIALRTSAARLFNEFRD